MGNDKKKDIFIRWAQVALSALSLDLLEGGMWCWCGGTAPPQGGAVPQPFRGRSARPCITPEAWWNWASGSGIPNTPTTHDIWALNTATLRGASYLLARPIPSRGGRKREGEQCQPGLSPVPLTL